LPPPPLRYVLGDAREWLASKPAGSFEVYYQSSFTPDEQHRVDVLAGARTPLWHARRLLRERTGIRIGSAKLWPDKEEPFCDLVMGIVDRSLASGGLFFNQSYYAGVDIPENPHFVDAMQRQLRTLGIELIEVHHFVPHYAYVSLSVGLRGTIDDARRLAASLRSRPMLSNFHGRSSVARSIRTISLF
jgi:hypothetical protein